MNLSNYNLWKSTIDEAAEIVCGVRIGQAVELADGRTGIVKELDAVRDDFRATIEICGAADDADYESALVSTLET